jgi:hypothetical protein
MVVLHRPSPTPKHRLTLSLEELGFDVTQVPDWSRDISQADVVWAWGNANWYPRAIRAVAALPRGRRPPLVVWHGEPLPYVKGAGLRRARLHAREIAKILLRHAMATDPYSNVWRVRRLAAQGLPDVLVVTSEAKREFLAEIGIPCDVVPFGYHPTHGSDLRLERDIDILFLGALEVPRRKRALRRLGREGLEIQAVGGWSDPRYWGADRARLLNRARIMLNISRHPGQYSGERLVLGMANRALVVSEPMYRPEPFVPGVHYVEATLDEMPGVMKRYLRDDRGRERVASRGHRFVTEQLRMTRSVERIVDLAERRLAAGGG